MSGEPPERALRCRACSAELPPGSGQCRRCGALQSDDVACPHCTSVASVSPDAELRYRCDVCGAPRLPLAAGARVKGKELPHLKRAEAARKSRAAFRFGAVAAGAAFPFLTAVSLLIGLVWGMVPALAAFVVLGVPAAVACIMLWARSNARGKEIQPALDQAWLAVATELAERSSEPLTSARLAASLGIDESRAEELLAVLDASDVVRGNVTTGGDISYQARMRVDEPAARAEAAGTDEARAEDEAAAAMRAAEAVRKETRGT